MTDESRDGTGAGDHDQPFLFGQHMACLTWLQQERCLRMRGLVRDVRHAPANLRGELRFGGDDDDDDWQPRPSGLLVHNTPWLGNWSPQAS
jgi:hypothetical protein